MEQTISTELLALRTDELEVYLQLVLAMVLGMLLGTERAIAGKTAGMRTFALVSLAACLFVTTSVIVTNQYIGITNFDPIRIAAGIIAGIGFIGGGLIIFRKSQLKGLTTAAGLWVAAGIGAAVGYQLYAPAIFTTLLTLFVFTILWYFERFIEQNLDIYESDHVRPGREEDSI
jgi:putative Mg2+ transporter-C (MgtC) family protein